MVESHQKKLLTVGILSDSQCNAEKDDWGFYNLEQAFAQLAEAKIDMLFTGGDLSETGDPAVYDHFRELVDKFFGKNPPEELHCIGNHDYGWSDDWNQRLKNYVSFCDGLCQSRENPCCKNIRGFNFVVLHSTPDGMDYAPEALEKLKQMLRSFSAEDSGKPVFLYTHRAPDCTVVSSCQNCEGDKKLRSLLNQFPQVISFSGHFHCPLEDERSIWQGEFTAVATATLSYGCIPEDAVNLCGPILPFAREVIQMLIMEIYPDEIILYRRQVTENREIKPEKRWRIALPYRPEKACYTDSRTSSSAPSFQLGSRLLTRYDYGYYYLIFNSAHHKEFTHFYEIELAEMSETQVVSQKKYLYVSNFYRLQECKGKREFFKMPGEFMSQGKTYRIRVYPVETFGKRGMPLETLLHIPSDRKVLSAKNSYPQE